MRIIFFILLFFSGVGFSCEVMDDKGNIIRMAGPAKRIISLAPDLTENLFAIGAGDQIVGVMQGSDYPAAAKRIPIVASHHRIDQEAIIALRPDLIVVWSDVSFLSQLKKSGVPIYHSHPQTLTDIPKTLQRLGCLTGKEDNANRLTRTFYQDYHELELKYRDKKKISVFYQVWSHPLITLTKQSWISAAIELCGGDNIFANLKGVAPEVNRESVVALDPQVIFGMKTESHWQKDWQSWTGMQAVRFHHLYSLDPDLMSRASVRLLIGTAEMCELIEKLRYPVKNRERYAESTQKAIG